MLRSLSKVLASVGALTFMTPPAFAGSPRVIDEINSTRREFPSVTEFRNRIVDKRIEPAEKALSAWEKFASQKGLSVEDRAAVDRATVEFLYLLGYAHLEVGHIAAAEPYILRAANLAAKLAPADDLEISFAFTIAGKLRRIQGNYPEAIQLFEKAYAIRKVPLSAYWDVRVLYTELAQVRKIQGDFKSAREFLKRIEQSGIAEAATGERASIDLVMGEYKFVEDLLKPAIKLLQNKNYGDPEVITALAHLADYHLMLGSPERAEEVAKDLLARREKLAPTHQFDIADALIRLGRVYVALGDVDQASSFAERAEKILQAISLADHVARVPLQVLQGDILMRKKDSLAAQKVFQLAYAHAEKVLGSNNYTTAKILTRLGTAQLADHDETSAYTSFSRAADTLEKTFGATHPDTCDAFDGLARVYLAQDKPGAAISILRKAMDARDRHAAKIFGYVSEIQKTRTMEKLRPETELAMRVALSMPENDDAVKLGLTAVFRRKGRVLDGMAMSRAALRDANSPDEMMLLNQIIDMQRLIVSVIIRGPQGRTPDEHRAMIRDLDAQKQQLEAQESRMSQRRLLQDNPVTFEEVAAALPKGSALVEYAVLPSPDGKTAPNYVAWVVFQDATVRLVDLGPADTINTLVTQARVALADSKADPKLLARKLDAAIMQPIRRVLGKTQWLFVSPDADLNLVPFGALRDEFDHWLLDSYSFTYLTSGRDLLLGEAIDEPAEAGAPAILMGNPDFGEKKLGRRRFAQRDTEAPAPGARARDITRLKFTPLAATTAEIGAIEKKIPGAQVFLGEKATETELKAIKHPRILHLATHGFFLPDKPSAIHPDEDAAAFRTDNPLVRAGLALGGANVLRSGEEDGVLTAFEAAGLDLYGTKLVVLSACETGIGDARSGEGVYGMRRALAMAGAETTVMSLWPVDDNGTKELMVGYYERLMAGGGRVESLRQAALTLKSRPGYDHPFYWASFIVSGDSTALSGKMTPPGPSPVVPGVRGCACAMPGAMNDEMVFPAAWGFLGIVVAMRIRRRPH